jgi:hypothetical protein
MIYGMGLDNFINLDMPDSRKSQARLFALPETA